MNLIDKVNEQHLSKNVEKFPKFKSGDTVAVSVRIKEGNKSRIQVFQGTVIARKNPKSINGHFRVRKISSGMGVERVFPYHSPNVEDIKVVAHGKTRRAKHYYLRERSGKSARIKIDYDRKEK
jgi:large subunit ribosomal protein L19